MEFCKKPILSIDFIISKTLTMKTTFIEENDRCVMCLEGRLDTNTSVQTEREMQVLNDYLSRDILLDCSSLEYISSSGLRLFLGLLKKVRAQGGHVGITGLSDNLLQVFDEIGFTQLFDIQ